MQLYYTTVEMTRRVTYKELLFRPSKYSKHKSKRPKQAYPRFYNGGVDVARGRARGLGTEVPQWGPGAKPR